MIIYMKHPKHGTKVAIMEAEAVADEKSGWVRYNPDTPSDNEAVPVNELEVKRRRRLSE